MKKEIVIAIIGALGIIIAAIIGYAASTAPIRMSIEATETAEARLTAAAQLYGLTPSGNSTDFPPTIETSVVLQITETPSNYADPKEFIQNYFALLNQRMYEEAWSKLSDQFKASNDSSGYDDYVAFWGTVDEIEIIKMEITSQSNTQVLVYVEINYRYTAGYTTTGHTTYKLVKDSSNSSWLFDPN